MRDTESTNEISVKNIVTLILLGGALIFGLVVACGTSYTIPAGERGILLTFSKPSPIIQGEGLHFKLPIVQDVVKLSIKQRTESRKTECFSSDLQTIAISYNVMFLVPESSILKVYSEYNGDVFTSLITPRVEESIKQVASHYTAEGVVKNRDKIKIEAVALINSKMESFVQILDLSLTNVDLSDSMEHAIDAKMVQEQQALAKNFELEKVKKEAEIQVVQAKAQAESSLALAQSEATGIKLKSQALAEAPQLVELEKAKRWDGKLPQTFMGNANTLFNLGTPSNK